MTHKRLRIDDVFLISIGPYSGHKVSILEFCSDPDYGWEYQKTKIVIKSIGKATARMSIVHDFDRLIMRKIT